MEYEEEEKCDTFDSPKEATENENPDGTGVGLEREEITEQIEEPRCMDETFVHGCVETKEFEVAILEGTNTTADVSSLIPKASGLAECPSNGDFSSLNTTHERDEMEIPLCFHYKDIDETQLRKSTSDNFEDTCKCPPQDDSHLDSVNQKLTAKSSEEKCDILATTEDDSSSSTLLKLPPELWLKIFSFLSLDDIFLRIAPLSRYCYHLARDPCMWGNVYIHSKCPTESATRILQQASHVKVLHVTNHPHNPSILLDSDCVGHNANSLICLNIGFNDLPCSSLNSIFKTELPHLLHLNLEGCRSVDVSSLQGILPRLPMRLARLNLSHCTRLTDDCFPQLFKCLPNLTHLNLDGIEGVFDDGVKMIVDNLGSVLQALWLDGGSLTSASCEILAKCHHLKLLSIRYCETFTNILPLRKMCSLRSLTLRKNTEIDPNQVRGLFDPRESCLTALTYLDISECYAVNDNIVSVICSLCGCSLLHLILNWCWEVTDVGIQSIAELCPNLTRLHLNGMHNLLGTPFGLIPSVFPRLSVLNLTNCNSIRDELIQRIVCENPHLIAFNYYGERFETVNGVRPELSNEHDLWRLTDPEHALICNC